ncbi:MAG: helix-turn-helix domain-containing protein [bacterium]
MPNKLDLNNAELAYERDVKGKYYSVIAKKHGCSASTVRRRVDKFYKENGYDDVIDAIIDGAFNGCYIPTGLMSEAAEREEEEKGKGLEVEVAQTSHVQHIQGFEEPWWKRLIDWIKGLFD